MSKLIICSPELGISPDSNSGGEVYDREILKHLARLGVKIEIILPKGRTYEDDIAAWSITRLPVKTIFPPYLFNLILPLFIFRVYKKSKFNLLRVHNPYFVGFAALFFKLFKKNIPVVASYLHLESSNIIFYLIDRLIIKTFDHIITISKSTRDEIVKKYSFPKEKISITYPGVDPKFRPKPKRKDLLNKINLEGKNVLLYFGGLKFRKNISFLLDMVKELNDDSVCLLICGEGNAQNILKLKTLVLGISHRVKFVGYVKEKEKVDFYNLGDVFLVPSKKEGFGMISIEAQACGKPVLVSSSSSLPETIINGKTGFACRENDLSDWTQKAKMLLADENLRRTMGKYAVDFVKSQFSWEKSARKQKEIFEHLLNV